MKAAIKKMPKGSTLTFSGIEVLNLKNQKKIKLDGGIILKLI